MKENLTAISIANYIVQMYKVNNLYLQKLLYYLQNNYMYQNSGQLLFNNKTQKWRLGPVIPEVYHAFKEYGTGDISEKYQEYNITIENGNMKIELKNDELPEEIKEFIDNAMNDLIKYDKFTLVDLTHKHPEWAECEREILSGSKNLEYDYNALYQYFSKNPKELLVNYNEN